MSKYDSLFITLEKVKVDNEMSHFIQDKIYRKFIRDIVNNKLNTLADIKIIADAVNKKVVKKDKNSWYA